jgi:hypothetical protein
MKDIIEHIEQDLDANLSEEISNLMLKLITSTNDINSLLGLEGFLPLLEQLNINKKTEICKKVIENFGKSNIS